MKANGSVALLFESWKIRRLTQDEDDSSCDHRRDGDQAVDGQGVVSHQLQPKAPRVIWPTMP